MGLIYYIKIEIKITYLLCLNIIIRWNAVLERNAIIMFKNLKRV